MKSKYFATSCVMLAGCLILGCVQTGERPSVWPKFGSGSATSSGAGISGAIGSTARGVKGQVASMGTVVNSAFDKAKTAVTSPFTTTPGTPGDEVSLDGNRPKILPEVHVAMGQASEASGNFAKALDSYSKALEAEPKNLAALASMARLYDRQGEPAKAIEFYEKATTQVPNDANLMSELGGCYARQGNLVKAREQYMKAIALDPKSANHRGALASVLVDEGRPDDALNELMQVYPPAMAHYQLGYQFFQRRNYGATQQQLAAALQIDPNLQPARDLMNKMGGPQLAQNAMGVYQTAGTIVNQVQGLVTP